VVATFLWFLGAMRADRLVATLLFLQSKGKVTAAEVADELEVSVRTARRDLEALSIAGIPVYSQPGRNGGWSLVGGARTDLSGLTATEARTLFLIAGPSSAVTPEAKAALRKLISALPETFRAEAERAASSVVLDPSTWSGHAPVTPPFLEALQQAVISEQQVVLCYVDASGAESERVVHPLGLVSKGTTWYLMADTAKGLRTFRVWRVKSVSLTGEPAVRPEGFDLAREWAQVVERLDASRSILRLVGFVSPEAVKWLGGHFGKRLTVGGPRSSDGWLAVELDFPADYHPAMELAGYAEVLEIVEPASIRDELASIGAALVARYSA
jgi:predicted DNA-binding transcriptional regulator YafY